MSNLAFDESSRGSTSSETLEAKFTFWGTLAATALEADFGRHLFPYARRQACLIGWLTPIPILLFAISDYQLFGFTPTFVALAAVRGFSVIVTLLGFAILRRTASMAALERWLLLWSLLQVGVLLFVNATRPAGYLSHAVWDVLAVILAYVALPTRLTYQVAPALLMSVGNITLLLLVKSPGEELTVTVVIAAHLCANLLGFIVSNGRHRWKRRLFVSLSEERQLRQALQVALAEIRTLRGIVPICAYCKRIRDEAGDWHQVETYVRDRTHADFTHGICPQCTTEVLAEASMPRK